MRWTNAFYLICISLCVSFSPEPVIAQQENGLLEKAHGLYDQGNFFEAAIAYERAYFFLSDTPARIEANLGRVQALKQTGDFRKARNDLQRSLHQRQYPELHSEILYELAFCEYMLGNYLTAIGVLQQMEHYYPHKATKDEVLLLYSLSAIMAQNWEVAHKKTLEWIQLKNLEPALADNLVAESMMLFCECSAPVTLSENKARMWSTFVPGSGHVYTGYPGKGALNAGAQLLSLSAAGFMAWHNLYISGFVIGLGMFQSFYFGGINQAGYLAGQKNLLQMGEYKQRLKEFVFKLDMMANSE